VAGLATALKKPLLMLAEREFLAPVDYCDLLKHYHSARDAVRDLDQWLGIVDELASKKERDTDDYARRVALAAGLKRLKLGAYIAEEEATAPQDWFVETLAFRDALNGKRSVFVGHKGSGKTANLLMLKDELTADKRNLVCVIKPPSYEYEGLVEVMRKLASRDRKAFALEALWKYLLLTEIASALAHRFEGKDASALSGAETEFLTFVDASERRIRDHFAVRLEECVHRLASLYAAKDNDAVSAATDGISEALHAKPIPVLVGRLLAALQPIRRVIILIDNLDKGWDRRADLALLSEVLLGLLGAVNRVKADLLKGQRGTSGVEVSLALFLRADIFEFVRQFAHEPDKLNPGVLTWEDPDLLSRVLEERYATSHQTPGEHLWRDYFCNTVAGVPTKQYILRAILPRPRDLLYFANAALEIAINRGHSKIDEGDIVDARQRYSQLAFDSILVGNGVTVANLEAVLYEFAGALPTVTSEQVHANILRAGLSMDHAEEVTEHLIKLGFVGVEVSENEWRFL
jgi:hypothetical protein